VLTACPFGKTANGKNTGSPGGQTENAKAYAEAKRKVSIDRNQNSGGKKTASHNQGEAL
jgi:hypothetical protein